MTPALVGRERELAQVGAALTRAAGGQGSALLIRGEPGIGKSALLEAAAASAAAAGFDVLRTSGVTSEATLPFAALERLVRHRLNHLEALAPPQRQALEIAVGLRHGGQPEIFLIALAVLHVLAETAASTPLLVVAEDAHWLDDGTADVLGFIARRLELEPILLLLTTRDETGARLDAARLPELALTGLDRPSAEALLDGHAPNLTPPLRTRVLELAQGNPLALIELPRSRIDAAVPVNEVPLTQRLERVFSERLDHLPPATRTTLLVAALDEGAQLRETLAAAATLDLDAGSVAAFAPAEKAQLVTLHADTIRFRHPLVQAAISANAGTVERQAAHRALAAAYAHDPDRSIWHQAAALSEPDEAVAAGLEQAADRAERRGAPALAVATLARSIALTPDETVRGNRLVKAAEIHYSLGRTDVALNLLTQARTLELDEVHRARVAFILEVSDTTNWNGSERATSIADVAEDLIASGDRVAALHALHTIAFRLWWSNPDPSTRKVIAAIAERAAEHDDDPLLLKVLGAVDPIGRGAFIRERVSRYTPDATDPMTMSLLGFAADSTFSHDLALPFLSAAAEGLREQGRLGLLGQVLTSQAYVAIHLAKAPLALAAAEEAERIARDINQPLWEVAAQLARAIVAAERGDAEQADSVADAAEAVLIPFGANPLLSLVQFTRGRGAVAHQRYEDGYLHLRRIFDSADTAYQPLVGLWALADLIESADATGRQDEAEVYLEQLEEVALTCNGSSLRAQLAYARPLLASDDDAGDLYQAALDHGLISWPCYRGRLLLAYGRWLRRQRRVAESRAPLRAARELFDAVGFNGLAESARAELRASGETSRSRGPDYRDELTAQELQIAQMAAEGLTNRQIGSKLYLSHRTVGSHLYRLFPKLGISSRGQLREVLGEVD